MSSLYTCSLPFLGRQESPTLFLSAHQLLSIVSLTECAVVKFRSFTAKHNSIFSSDTVLFGEVGRRTGCLVATKRVMLVSNQAFLSGKLSQPVFVRSNKVLGCMKCGLTPSCWFLSGYGLQALPILCGEKMRPFIFTANENSHLTSRLYRVVSRAWCVLDLEPSAANVVHSCEVKRQGACESFQGRSLFYKKVLQCDSTTGEGRTHRYKRPIKSRLRPREKQSCSWAVDSRGGF